MIVRAARADDVDEIVRVMRTGFSEQILRATIYGTKGIAAFIASQIKVPFGLSDTVYFVADIDGHVAGCVELRRLADALFLNYIAVRPESRSSGLARTLLRDSIVAVRDEYHSRMLLDVFTDNSAARHWYERLGFDSLYTTEWWSIQLDRDQHALPSVVAGYPQAAVVQDCFDFSQFVVRTPTSEYAIGRIGIEWFRLTQAEALQDPGLLSTLAMLDGERRILGLFRQGTAGPDAAQSGVILLTSCRMAVDLQLLVDRLTQGAR